MAEFTVLGKIDTQLLEKEFGKLKTNTVIVTHERLVHIKQQHPQDIDYFYDYALPTVQDPDIIIKDLKNPETVFMVKVLENTNLNVIVKLVLEGNDENIQNSVMTFYRIRTSNLKKIGKKSKSTLQKGINVL